jgi:hypothetical protein
MKETIMNTTEMMIHVHRQLDARTRADLEKNIMGRAGSNAQNSTRPCPLMRWW